MMKDKNNKLDKGWMIWTIICNWRWKKWMDWKLDWEKYEIWYDAMKIYYLGNVHLIYHKK
jgi:hypothetical protein